MPDSNKFSREDWRSWDSIRWNQYFQRRGMDYEIPILVGSYQERLVNSAKILVNNSINDFSGMELAAIANMGKWEKSNTNSLIAGMYQILSRRYKDDDSRSKLGIPAIHLLRIEVGAHRGNLHTCLGYEISDGKLVKTGDAYYDIGVSKDDWMEGISIPLPSTHGNDFAEMMGFIWGLGSISSRKQNVPTFSISAKSAKYDLLLNEVRPKLESAHTMKVRYIDSGDIFVKLADREFNANSVGLTKGSVALTSYLENFHGMPVENRSKNAISRKPKSGLPNISWNAETIDNFVLGLVKTRGGFHDSVTKRAGNEWTYGLSYASGEGSYSKDLSDLLTSRAITHNLQFKGASWRLQIGPRYSAHLESMLEK